MRAALPAFLLEAVFYLGSVLEETRASVDTVRSRRLQALLLWSSALAPYLVFATVAGTWETHAFGVLAVLTGVLAYWYVVLPRRVAFDFGFLSIAAAPVLLHVFRRIYVSPSNDHFRVDILGHLMWIRLAIASLLLLRRWNPGAFGFWPRASEWRIGFGYYAAAILPIALLALWLHDVRFALADGPWWRVAGLGLGVFFGTLWVVALGEDLLFRGVIERALLDRWRSPAIGVMVSALLFGAVHLWFQHFPNWQRAVVVTALGVACGLAYWQSRSVRASMVTHALVVATWRVFFRA